MAEATIGIPTLSLVLAAAVIVAGATFGANVPVWLAFVPLGLVVAESGVMLVYAVRVARTASLALEESRLRQADGDDVRHALGEAAREGGRQ